MADPLLPAPTSYAQFARLRGDPAVWLPGLRAICDRHGLDGTALYAERSGTNVLFRAGKGPWIKLFAPLWREDHAVERRGLLAVTDRADIPAPELLAEGTLEDWPYLVLSHLDGCRLGEAWVDLDEATQVGLAEQLGALLAALARVPVAGFPAAERDWPRTLGDLRASCVQRHAGAGASAAWLDGIRGLVQALPADFALEQPPVFLHADLTDDNVLVAERGGRWTISGLVDFGDAFVGHPHYELAAPAVFLFQRRPRAQHALLRAAGLPASALSAELAQRLTAFVLLHRYSSVPLILRCCPPPAPRDVAELREALWQLG